MTITNTTESTSNLIESLQPRHNLLSGCVKFNC